MKPSQIYLAALIIIELVLSFYIYYSISTHMPFCIIGKGCDAVQNSYYGNIFGMQVSLFGTIAFALLFILYLYAHKSYKRYRFFLACTSIGALFSLYFLYLQISIIKSICSSCVIIDGLMIFIFVWSLKEFLKLRKYY